jgi:hypothetical protein
MAADYLDDIRDRDDRVRQFEWEGKTWTLRAENPYGFWKIHTEKGPLAAELSGAYTSYIQAEMDIKKWAFEQGKMKENKAKNAEAKEARKQAAREFIGRDFDKKEA